MRPIRASIASSGIRADRRIAGAYRAVRRHRSGGVHGLLQSDQRGRRATRIYTTEKAGPRVKAYDFEREAAGGDRARTLFDANCKNMNIAVDPRGRVYVVDTVKLAILVFEPVNA